MDALSLLYLAKSYPPKQAAAYLRDGITKSQAKELPPDVSELIGPITIEKKLRYLGRQTIRKRGCFGCHDIAGFEDAQPMGPALTDWGRKQESLLGFEEVHRYLEGSEPSHMHVGGEPDRTFYLHAIRSRRREGFLWQKLRDPRSFDYQRTAEKGYQEHLLMGRFSFTPAEREAVMTFVLGLVGEVVNDRYLPPPDSRPRAIARGRTVLDKFACARCHTLRAEHWTVEVAPGTFPSPRAEADDPLVRPQLIARSLAASQSADRRGLCRVELVGMPLRNTEGSWRSSATRGILSTRSIFGSRR